MTKILFLDEYLRGKNCSVHMQKCQYETVVSELSIRMVFTFEK